MTLRFRALVLAIVVLAAISSVLATGADAGAVDYAYVWEEFSSATYSGGSSDGGEWTTPWKELGESDGPTAGVIQVTTLDGCSKKCLVVDGSGEVVDVGVDRSAGFEISGDGTLRYRISMDAPATASVTVQVARDGSDWTTVGIHVLDGSFERAIGLVDENVGVRFLVDGVGVGGLLGGPVGIDDVKVIVESEPSATTTTTSVTIPSTVTTSTITVPPTSSSTTSTTTSSTSTTTTTTAPSTTTTAPNDAPDDPQREVVPPPGDDPTDTGDDPATSGPTAAPVERDPVMVELEPGLVASARIEEANPSVVRSLLVPFGMRTEELNVDLALFVLLGLVLAAFSGLRLHRKERPTDE